MVAASIHALSSETQETPIPLDRIMASSQGGLMEGVDAFWCGLGSEDGGGRVQWVTPPPMRVPTLAIDFGQIGVAFAFPPTVRFRRGAAL
jgi:hypothetical protein